MKTENLSLEALNNREAELMKELAQIRKQLAALKQPKQPKRTKQTNDTESFMKMSRAIIESRNKDNNHTRSELEALSKQEIIKILDDLSTIKLTEAEKRKTKKYLIDAIIRRQRAMNRGEAFKNLLSQ